MTKNEENNEIIARPYTEERKSETPQNQMDLRQWHQHIRSYIHAHCTAHSIIDVAINISNIYIEPRQPDDERQP